jgi:hypothetical protein
MPVIQAPQTTTTTPQPTQPVGTDTLRQIRDHLQRYKELSSQGKLAEAGKELEEIQRLALK